MTGWLRGSDSSASAMIRSCLLFLLLALLCLPWSDFSIHTADPWLELGRLGQGLLTPELSSFSTVLEALAKTLAFALQGVALAVLAGFCLALFYQSFWVRGFAAFIRSIHELFWALLFIQLFGLTPATGVLALAVPYAGTFAKIYGELFEEADPRPTDALPSDSRGLSRFAYTVLPQVFNDMVHYTRYRLECGLRSSAVLGFVGLPTLGFYLETALSQGLYSEAATLFYAMVLLIGTMRWWLQRYLIPIYLLVAVWWLPPVLSVDASLLWRFFTVDIVPAPLRAGAGSEALLNWLGMLWSQQIAPGTVHTLVLALLSLLVTALLTLAWFPLVSPLFGGRATRTVWHWVLVALRSVPEYMLAFIGLLLWGPSMLPALVALSVHNAAILAHLVGNYSGGLQLREDSARGFDRYSFEVLPRVFRQFMAFTLYRFEILLRETAIVGVLGIPTLGFYIDSAFSEFRFDRAFLLLMVTAVQTMTVDAMARGLRRRLHLSTSPETL